MLSSGNFLGGMRTTGCKYFLFKLIICKLLCLIGNDLVGGVFFFCHCTVICYL